MLAKEPDPSTLAPLCGEAEFAAIVASMVADESPRLFAVVQEYGDRVTARIAAWGFAFDDHAELVSVDRSLRIGLGTPGGALRILARHPHISTRLVWVDPDAATPPLDDEPA
jgi:hypothetical protein